MRIHTGQIAVAIVLFIVAGCGITPIEFDDSLLDGNVIQDTSFTDPTFQLSTHPGIDTIDKETPVIICVHGYTACTYEWQEFREYALKDGRVVTSLVLLGGHGRSVEEFDGSTWKEWQEPIMKEYDAIVKSGFRHISFVGSSTGGTLLLEYLSKNAFTNKTVTPENFVFIDPLVVPASKLMHIINVVGPMLGNAPKERKTEIEKRHWYTNRPASTLKELNALSEHVRVELEHGIALPAGASGKCFKSSKDDAVDPVSALLIYKGLHTSDGSTIDVEMVESDYHVFTLLSTRPEADSNDHALQETVFKGLVSRALKSAGKSE